MLKMSLIAVASIIAFGSVSAAEQTTTKEDGNGSAAADAEPAVGQGASARQQGFVVSGSARSNIVTGTAVSQSGTRAPALVPVTPFVTYATSGHAGDNVELQRQIQDIQERERRMLQNPEYRDLLRARQRFSLYQTHPDLAELLQISKEQATQLLDLLAEHQVREQAEGRPMWPGQVDRATVEAFTEETQERQRIAEAELAALLGPSKFEEWREYEQSTLARFMLQRLQIVLPEDARLRADQRGPLLRAIAREQRQLYEDETLRLPQGHLPDEAWQKRMQERQLERMSAMNERILAAAAPILSSRQLEALRSMLQQELDGHSQRQFFFGGRAPLVAPTLLSPQR